MFFLSSSLAHSAEDLVRLNLGVQNSRDPRYSLRSVKDDGCGEKARLRHPWRNAPRILSVLVLEFKTHEILDTRFARSRMTDVGKARLRHPWMRSIRGSLYVVKESFHTNHPTEDL